MANNTCICLTMIIKNEQNIIIRCLESVLPIVDYVFITDTGSEDETIKIVTDWINDKKSKEMIVDGSVRQGNKFENFGKSRTESFQYSKFELKKRNIRNCYLLLLDADMKLKIENNFNKQDLVCPSYDLYQVEGNKKYTNTRLIDFNLNWKCKGVTHEYWDSGTVFESELLHTLSIIDVSDGNNKQDKHSRDLNLLLSAIKCESDFGLNQRYTFYIAETYFILHEYDHAIEWYNKRIRLQGWIEEVFYSKYMIGKCYMMMYHNTDDVKHLSASRTAYLDAWYFRPVRIEPIYWLCVTEMNLNITDERKFVTQVCILVYMYCNYISKVKFPSNDKLFIESSLYDWKCWYLLYISSFYAQDREARDRSKEMLKGKVIDKEYRDCMIRFAKRYNW